MTRLFWFRILQNSLLCSSRRCSFVSEKTAKTTKLLFGYRPSAYKVISAKMDSDSDLGLESAIYETQREFCDKSILIPDQSIDPDSETLPPLVDQCCKVTADTVVDDNSETTDETEALAKRRKALVINLDCDEELSSYKVNSNNDELQNAEDQSEVKMVKPGRKRNKRKSGKNRKVENESEDDGKIHCTANDGVDQEKGNEEVEKTKPKKMKKKKNEDNESGEDEKVKPPKTPRPNYFIAVRVSNPAIHSSIKVIQDSIISKEPLLQPVLIPLGTLHITLMVMHLEQEQLQQAVDTLHSCKNDLKKVFEDSHAFNMSFEGLGHFRNEVVFGKINGEDEITMLRSLASVIREGYKSNEIVPQKEDHPLEPHLTIVKLSRMPRKKKTKKIKKISPDTYSAWIDCELGQEAIGEVLLCSMLDKKEEDGFYHCVGKVDISSSVEEKNALSSSPGAEEQDNCTLAPELEDNPEIEEKTEVS